MYNGGADCDDSLVLYFGAKCWMALSLLVGADLSSTLRERAMFGGAHKAHQSLDSNCQWIDVAVNGLISAQYRPLSTGNEKILCSPQAKFMKQIAEVYEES
jgi:hypothetical protein